MYLTGVGDEGLGEGVGETHGGLKRQFSSFSLHIPKRPIVPPVLVKIPMAPRLCLQVSTMVRTVDAFHNAQAPGQLQERSSELSELWSNLSIVAHTQRTCRERSGQR